MQRIAFLGFVDAANYHHIGGMDSLVRRLALSLAEVGDSVDIVHYGAGKNQACQVADNIHQIFFKTLSEACLYLKDHCDHVISIYIKPCDRIYFARFRRSYENVLRFHHIYSNWSEFRIKREMAFAEARLFPFNGRLFCVSPRIYQYVSSRAPRAELLLPPVPASYFHNCSDKLNDGLLRVTYAGRIDAEKGTIEALDVLRRLAAHKNIVTRFCGFAWIHKPQSLRLHRRLLFDADVVYEAVDYRCWEPQVDRNLAILLRETDILLLPYRRLSSTVDTPLLLLEGMASLCAVMTPPLGDLHQMYGPSHFNLCDNWGTDKVVRLIENARVHLPAERQRLMMRAASLGFEAENVVTRFRKSLCESV